MKVDLGIWAKLTRAIIFLLLIAAVAGVVVWYLPLIDRNEGMRKTKLKLEMQIKQEEEKQRQLRSFVRSLQDDPKTLERLAREKLGYAKTTMKRLSASRHLLRMRFKDGLRACLKPAPTSRSVEKGKTTRDVFEIVRDGFVPVWPH